MRHIRWDDISGTPVLVAPERSTRPHDAHEPLASDVCPFCEGSEHMTPAEVLADRPEGGPANGPGWRVRAFPNRYPSLPPDLGPHEVVVNTPLHVGSFGELDPAQAGRAAAAWMARLEAAGADHRVRGPFWFLNQGTSAGASLHHSHAQVIGLPFDPPALVRREAAFGRRRCPICAQIGDASDRLVAHSRGLVAWCPDAPPWASVVRIAPAAHLGAWDGSVDPSAIGETLRAAARAVADVAGTDDMNMWLTARRPHGVEHVHWHVDVVPRVESLAGLELGAGVVTLTSRPEATAGRLRTAWRDSPEMPA